MRLILTLLWACSARAADVQRTPPVALPQQPAALGSASVPTAPAAAEIPSLDVRVDAEAASTSASPAAAASDAAPGRSGWRAAFSRKPMSESSQAEWKGPVRALMYGVMFSERPQDETGRILDALLQPGTPWSKPLLESSVAQALASKEPLAKLLPQSHSEETIRGFLSAVQQDLKSRK